MKKKDILVGVVYSTILTLVLFRNFFFRNGLAQTGDLIWPCYPHQFSTYLWYEYGQFFRLPQQLVIYGWLWKFFSFSPEFSEKLIYFLVFSIMTFSAYYVTFKTFEYELGNNDKTKTLLSMVLAFAYTVTPLSVYYTPQIFLLWGYAFYPFFLYAVFLSLKTPEKYKKYSTLLAILVFIMSGDTRWVVWSFTSFLIIGVLHLAKKRFILGTLREYLRIYLLTLFVFLLLSAFWLVPVYKSSQVSKNILNLVVTENLLKTLNKYSTLVNSLRFHSDFWEPTRKLFLSHILPKGLWKLSGLVLPIFAFLSVIFYPKKHKVLVLFSISLIVILVSSVMNLPFRIKDLYIFFVFNIPFGVGFRTTYKWLLLLPSYLILLAGYSLLETYKKTKNKNKNIGKTLLITLCILLLVTSAINSWPLLTGDRAGTMKAQKIPPDYHIAYGLIKMNLTEELEKGYKILVWPKSTHWRPPIPIIREDNVYIRYLENTIREHKTVPLKKILCSIDTKYILLTNTSDTALLDSLFTQKGIHVLYKGKNLVLFELNCNPDEIKIGNSAYVSPNADLDQISAFSSSVFLGNISPVFNYNLEQSKSILKTSITTLGSLKYVRVTETNNSQYISPFIFTIQGNPSKTWSKATMDSWHSYLKSFGIENWQFDYGKGLVFTWASREIPKDLTLRHSDLIASWNFSNKRDLNSWKNMTPEKQFNAIQELRLDNNSLQVLLWNSTRGWKTVRSPLITVEPDHVYHFELRIKGYNANKVHIKIAEFDKNKKYLSTKYITGVGDGTFNWKTITFNYQPENENTKYIQIQIWHGYKTNKPLPNRIWIGYVKVYDITNYTKPVTLEIPFKVDKTDNYKLFIRYFKNQRGGAIRVYLDGRPVYIKTKDQLNQFVWEDLGTFKLEKGEHKIVLENVRGFNAVNLFALVPENEYFKAKKKVERILQNKTLIYIFEAESDLYREKAEIIKDFNASNGEAVKFKDKGKAWQNVEIVKNSTYKIALKGIGTFNISIGNYSYILTSNTLTFKYTPTFYLRDGEYKLKIVPLSKNAILDVVWLYSTNKNNETLNDLFKTNETPATVQNYRKINPTLWKVKVNATKPFFLTFAESYDPLWEAKVYKDGKLVEKVHPVPVYGVINGFWINQTGNLEIVLRYTPQDWFERGLIISLTTFIMSILYLFYDWRREKGDRWAKRLEKKIKDMVTSLKSRIRGVLRR